MRQTIRQTGQKIDRHSLWRRAPRLAARQMRLMRLTRVLATVALLPVMVLGQALAADGGPELIGKKLFDARCGICHTPPSIGYVVLARRNGEALAVLPERKDLAPDYINWVVRHGLGLMPPFTRVMLSKDELVQVTAYLTRNNPPAVDSSSAGTTK